MEQRQRMLSFYLSDLLGKGERLTPLQQIVVTGYSPLGNNIYNIPRYGFKLGETEGAFH